MTEPPEGQSSLAIEVLHFLDVSARRKRSFPRAGQNDAPNRTVIADTVECVGNGP